MSLAAPAQQSWLRWFAIWEWPFKQRSPLRIALLVMAVGFLTTFSYGLLYRQTLRLGVGFEVDPIALTEVTFAVPGYGIQNALPRSFGDYLPILFAPAHQMDRWLRPGLWSKSVRQLTPDDLEEFISGLAPEEFELLPDAIKDRFRSAALTNDSL